MLLRLGGVIQGVPSGLSDVHAVAAPVLGITAADQVTAVLELVEEQDNVLGVHAEHVDQLLLRSAVVVAEVTERHEEPEVHPEQLGPAPAHHLLEQARDQKHPGSLGGFGLCHCGNCSKSRHD